MPYLTTKHKIPMKFLSERATFFPFKEKVKMEMSIGGLREYICFFSYFYRFAIYRRHGTTGKEGFVPRNYLGMWPRIKASHAADP